MYKKILLAIFAILLLAVPAFATTYYASPSGGGAASCVDNGANVCTLQRAITVAAGGTNTIEMANGTYSCSTACALTSTNTGANLTFQPAAGATVTVGSTGTLRVIDIDTTMVSGTVTFNNVNFNDNGADYIIENRSPLVNVVYTNGTCTNTDTSVGSCIYMNEDTTNRIAQTAGNDLYTGLRLAATTNVKLAQQITVGGSNITVNRVALFLKRNGAFAFNTSKVISVTLETDTAGAPSGTPVTNGTSGNVEVYDLNPNGEWVFFDFSTNVSLTAATVYHVVLQGDTTASTTNYISWAGDSTAGAYAGGDGATFDGTNWTAQVDHDYLFAVNRNHVRDVSLTNSTCAVVRGCVQTDWVRDVTITGNTLSQTGGTGAGLINTNLTTESGQPFNKVLIDDNDVSVTGTSALMYSVSVASESNYGNLVVITNNTGVTNFFVNIRKFVRKLFIQNNDLEITASGNTPFYLGEEVNGSDPQETAYYPFEQIIIEDNDFYYSATSHNHLFLAGLGSDNGIYRNNTIDAPGSSGAWGLIIKSNGWFIEGNRYYGPGPAVYLSGTNHSRVTFNTFETYGGDVALLIRNHQDSIYAGINPNGGIVASKRYGIAFYNYVADNIFISNGAFQAVSHCDTSGCSGASTLGANRTESYWSNRIDNNIYYARDNTNQFTIGNGASVSQVTEAEGVAELRATWQSTTYTDSGSMAQFNDSSSLNSFIGDPSLPGAADGIFTSGSSRVKGQGMIPNSSIGGFQPSAGSSGGPFGTMPHTDP